MSNKRARLRESPGLYECWMHPSCLRMITLVFDVCANAFPYRELYVKRTQYRCIVLYFMYYSACFRFNGMFALLVVAVVAHYLQ